MSEFKRKRNRFFFKILRWIKPVITFGDRVFVFRDADVREILERHQDFTVSEINAANIERQIGPFMLGMDEGPELEHERGAMRSVIRRDDVERIRTFIQRQSKEILTEASGKGEFDLVKEFTRIVPQRMVGDYFGVPGPDPQTMLHWNRSIFRDIFMNLNDDQEVRKVALESSKEMNAYLNALIAGNKKVMNEGGRLPDNLLSRLLALQPTSEPSLDDDGIRRNLAGSYMGGIEPIAQAVAQILQQLILRPDMLALARTMAIRDDMEGLKRIAFEAWRFHPNLPVIIRYSRETQYLQKGRRRKRKIKAGKTIFAMTASAMFDGKTWEKPDSFLPERNPSKHLQFGFGFHRCLGEYINLVAIPEMLAALLRLDSLEPTGELTYNANFPDSWKFKIG